MKTTPWMEVAGKPRSNHWYPVTKIRLSGFPTARVSLAATFVRYRGSPGDEVLTIQGHPELSTEYSEALMGVRRELLGENVYRNGMESLQQRTDERLFTQWMLAFCRSSAKNEPIEDNSWLSLRLALLASWCVLPGC